MKVWIVVGEHPYVPGMVIRVCASGTSANTEAASLVNIMLKDLGHRRRASNDSWGRRIKELQVDHECLCFVSEREVQD
jgi:hypothetical protein